MRIVLLLLTGWLLFLSCSHTKIFNDRINNQLRGEIKSCREYYNNLPGAFPGADTNRFNDHELFYNTDGQLIKQIHFATKVLSTFITIYTYSNSQRLDSTFDNNGEFSSLTVNSLNKDGYITKTSDYNTLNNSTFNTVYTYDDKNRLIEKIEYSPSGQMITREVYTMDRAGRKIQRRIFTSSNKLESYDIYHYDAKGNNINTNYYSQDGVLVTKYNYEYDSLNNMTLSQFYNIGHDTTIAERMTYNYDNHQNWIEKVHYQSGKQTGTTKRELVYY